MHLTRILTSYVIQQRPSFSFTTYFTNRFYSFVLLIKTMLWLYFFKIRSNRSSAAASTLTTSGAMGLSEKTFLNPKKMTASKEIRDEKGPSLDDFDKEIEIYQVSLSCINPTDPRGCPLDRVFKEMEHFKEERT